MEAQPVLSKLSCEELRRELKRLKKFRDALLAAIPGLETREISLTSRYEMGREGNRRGPSEELIETENQIESLTLELLKRDQALDESASALEQDTKSGKLQASGSGANGDPEASEQLGLPKPPASNASQADAPKKAPGGVYAPSPRVELTPREKKIWDVIQRGSSGLLYCHELENARIRSPRTGVWKDCPAGTYPAAYHLGEPWRHRIQDEKSKIKRKAERAKTLASE